MAVVAAISPGAACAAGLNESAVLQAVETVVAEHKAYATCLALDPLSFRLVQDGWKREVMQSAETLKGLNASPAFMLRFVAAVNPDRLIDLGMPLSAAMSYCQKNESQVRKFHEFGFSRLSNVIDRATKQ